MGGLTLDLPTGYYLERDPDVLTLRRTDGSVVAAFSALGATPSAVREAAEQAGTGSPRVPSISEARPSHAPPHTPRLRVWFFGSFELSGESGKILQPSRGSRAISVLKYLLAHEGRPVSQDLLMGWLWPESDLKRARWSLNSTIYALRKLLNEVVASSTDSQSHVLLDEGCYRLYPGLQVTSDVEEFDACYERGRLAEKAGRPREAIAAYEKGVELYRGDYLIEDLYEDWTMVERERLAYAYVDMLDRLADHYAETGRVRAAIRTCHRILEKDPCHEHTHRRLMQHYVRLGLRGRALNQYELCQKILRHTCEMPPSPETEALHESLFPGSSS